MGRRMSAKRMEAAVRAYFAQCDGTRERVPQKGGGFAERQIPYTLYGLSAAVSLSPQEVLLAAHGRGQGEGPASGEPQRPGLLCRRGQGDREAGDHQRSAQVREAAGTAERHVYFQPAGQLPEADREMTGPKQAV